MNLITCSKFLPILLVIAVWVLPVNSVLRTIITVVVGIDIYSHMSKGGKSKDGESEDSDSGEGKNSGTDTN